MHDLVHRGVRPDDGLNLKFAIVLLRRHSVPKDHAGSYRVSTLDVRVIKAFDVNRQRLHAQHALQLLKRIFLEFGGVCLL